MFESTESHLHTGLNYIVQVLKKLQFKNTNVELKLYKNNQLQQQCL
jgi:hypothetical protein